MTDREATSDPISNSSPAFEALLREVARQPLEGGWVGLTPGQKLDRGRFEILRRIDRGGMGVVYEAFDCTRREKVALKTLSRLDPGAMYRLKNEFRALAGVSHPNLVRLHELCVDDAQWFFTMELVAGERFDGWVRPQTGPEDELGALDEPRLRSALPQLVEAVAAIHAAGKLHRDLKPSNVLVTPDGRVVVLDFGLAMDPDAGGVGQTLTEDSVSGTPAYMSPEQAAGHVPTAASDLYSVGVMLFEALTGTLPFEGREPEIMVDKQRVDAPPPSQLAAGAPPDLDALCVRLLAREPSVRPDAAGLRALLGPSGEPCRSSARTSWPAREAPALLGREAELAMLREAFAATLRGQAVVLFVSGESGIGKSALCEAFLNALRTEGRATVLSGRCYEREKVRFRGLDSLVDDLSRHLRKLSREEAVALLPRDVYALTRLFPVLGRVEVVAAAPARDVPDPLELRRRAYAAFGELLGRMRDRAPLCMHIDDAQWLDTDAVLLMRALLVQPEPVPALLVLSHRSEGAEENAALRSVRDAIESNSQLALRTLAVGPLAQEAARDLALRMVPPGAGADSAAIAIARESEGSPFFVGELCRYVARHGGHSALEQLSLQAALGDHLSALSPPARRLLEHCALAGKPLPADVLLQAARATHAELDCLRASHLLRSFRLEDSADVDCYHDKVREVVAGALTESQRVECFAALARALEANAHGDLELIAACFEGSGEHAVAAEHWARAAQQAMAGAAFLHAAELYDKALALGSFTVERRHTLCVAQGARRSVRSLRPP